jgi:glycosyltransferase involved in cell wall biosynthesis
MKVKRKLAIVNTSSMYSTYGGVAPIIRNMDEYFQKTFDVKYFYPKGIWDYIPIGRIRAMLYCLWNVNRISKFDFVLSHIPEGSYVISFLRPPYAHIYHGNTNPMVGSKYWFGKYFAFVFDFFSKRIEKTSSIQYTVGEIFDGVKKLYNPIKHNVQQKHINARSGFIYTGRLEQFKNIDRLIKIYSQIPINMRNANHLYIAGYGTKEESLRILVKELGLGNYIHFMGSVPNQQLIEEVSTKRLFLMASSFEGLPTAIAEALSVGLPVVSTNVGDIERVVKNDYNGYTLPLDFTDDEYIKAIVSILDNYELFSNNAKISSKVFDAEEITNSMIEDINKFI